MVYEDFTIYTEVDVDADRIQKTSNHIDIYCIGNEDTYVYKDKGVGHFGNFKHLIDGACASAVGLGARGPIWVLSNLVDDLKGQRTAENKYLALYFYKEDPAAPISEPIFLEYWDGSTYHYDTSNFDHIYGTMYYFTITRDGTTLTCKIYSDSARTNLLDTLTLEVTTDSFRYIYAGCTYDGDVIDTRKMDCDIENLDLQSLEVNSLDFDSLDTASLDAMEL